ncbi:uncharacterized protein LOC131929563, partial [Physella acuta]|uniref:uncharacterized protein LOC131929563 n=1 Tax=Physella acuta TaxID=109671 RepID=UPI0027DC69B2
MPSLAKILMMFLQFVRERKILEGRNVVIVSAVFSAVFLHFYKVHVENSHVSEWLERNQLSSIADVLSQAGGSSLAEVYRLDETLDENSEFYLSLNKEQRHLLELTLSRLRDETEMEMWLRRNNIENYSE